VVGGDEEQQGSQVHARHSNGTHVRHSVNYLLSPYCSLYVGAL
jgi:hypothetical protein